MIVLNIETNIKEINIINEKIEKCNSNGNAKINFIPEDNEEINKFLNTIKMFGKITDSENLINTKIISENEIKQIQNWLIQSIGEFKNCNLIYKATEHGDSKDVLFSKCKNKKNLIWIMKDKNNNIFGCFNSIAINGNNSYSKDSKCFLYSINKKKKYLPNLNVQNNIYHCSSHIIEFGDSNKFEFVVGEKFLSKNSITFSNNNIFNHNCELCNNSAVSLVELEVFQVILN